VKYTNKEYLLEIHVEHDKNESNNKRPYTGRNTEMD
jgi:hypothetical protein